jgi:predicted oxidoreductase
MKNYNLNEEEYEKIINKTLDSFLENFKSNDFYTKIVLEELFKEIMDQLPKTK